MNKIHVQAPTNVVFLCGGPFPKSLKGRIRSLRDAFLRVSFHDALADSTLILAETVTQQFDFSSYYKDLMEFESDLAQIAELIILFCESEGSFAELGAFAQDAEIAKRLLVVIRNRYETEKSFITLGPIARLTNQSESAVFTVNDEDLGIKKDSHSGVSLDRMKLVMHEALTARIATDLERSTFDKKRDGHIIKLIVGLIQDYGALTETEILETLKYLGISISRRRLGAYLLCAKAVDWIELQSAGYGRYFVPLVEAQAAQFTVSSDAKVKGRGRRNNEIRLHWAVKDRQRFEIIRKSTKALAHE